MPVSDHQTFLKIRTLWHEFERTPFPYPFDTTELAAELALLDSTAAGCISSFIGSGGRLDSKRTAILSRCAKELQQFPDSLSDIQKGYFTQLYTIVEAILSYLNAPQTTTR